MSPRDLIFFSAIIFAISIILFILLQPRLKTAKRKKIMASPIPTDWNQILKNSFPLYTILPGKIRQNLQKKMLVFLAEKQFIPCNGLVLSEHMKILIAAQACLLIANRTNDFYHTLKTILVYPEGFVAPSQNHLGNGMHIEGSDVLAGQSWQQGKVIVSWKDVQYGCQHAADGFNVSFHEFAHQLDQESGGANGAPALDKHLYEHWPEILGAEYNALQKKIYHNQPSLIDEYGATHPAEFFAVVSELYLEKPKDLKNQHQSLYQMLNQFYGLNPHEWH